MTNETAKPTPEKRHPFSFTIGEGPYKYVGSYDLGAALAHQETFGSTEQAFRDAPRDVGLGTCAHCGHAILDIRIIQRGDGKRFGVGSDCISKIASEGDISGLSALERQIRADNRRKNDARKAAKIAALEPAYQAALDKLTSVPHPNSYFAGVGKTMRDYFLFCSKSPKSMQAAIAASGVSND